MKENKIIPKRRFKEFENGGAWEQHGFQNILNSDDGIRRGPFGSALKKEYFVPKSSYVVYEQRNAINDHYRVRYYITKEKYDELIRFKVNSGDYIMSGSGTVGRISKVPNGAKIGVFNQALIRIRTNENILDSEFFLQWMRSPNMQNKLTEANPASAMVNLVPMSEIKKWEILIPSREEQKKIGTFFSNLDNLITLHQLKLKKLKQTKSAYLLEMFPKEREKYPKRRFEGFTNPWEQVRIKDIFKVTRGHVLAATKTAREKTNSTPYPVYSSQTSNQGLMGYYNEYIYNDAITWTTDGANAGTVNYRKGKFYCTNVCGVLISEEGYANKMVSESLNKVAWKHVSKVGNPKLMNNVMSEIVIAVPKDIDEQNEISNFFINLDNRINLHQGKLEKLENIKKAYLNEMFV